MLKKQSLTRKKMAEEKIKSNEAQNLNPGPPSSVKTSQLDEKPELYYPEIQLKTPSQILKDRMEVAEVLVTSSVTGTSKAFIGKTLSKLWSPFEPGSYQNDNIDMRAKYQGEVERWKTANASELKELQDATKLRVKEATQKVKIAGVSVAKPRAYPKLGANEVKLPEPPRPPPRTRFIAQPKISDGSIWKPPPGTKQKLPFANDRKEKKAPVVSRKIQPPLSTLWKTPATGRKVTFATEVKAPPTSNSKGKLVIGNTKASVVKGTPGPKEKKVTAAKKVPVVPKKKVSLLAGDESNGSQISFAAVLKQSSVIPSVPGTTSGKTKKRGAAKAVSIKEPKDVSIVQGYIQFAPQGAGFQNNTFANSWNTRESGGDASNSLDRFQIDVDMDGFEDDEIFFQTDDTSLLVTGLRPKKPEANARKVTEVVEFPEGVYPEALRISRNSIGVLTVEQY